MRTFSLTPKGSPSQEGLGLVLLGAGIGALVYKARRDTKRLKDERDKLEEFRKRVKLLGDARWLDHQTFKTGSVVSKDILAPLSVYHAFPKDVPLAITRSTQKLTHYIEVYTNAVVRYAEQLGVIRQAFHREAEADAATAVKTMSAALSALKTPRELVAFPNLDVLGSCVLSYAGKLAPADLDVQESVAQVPNLPALTREGLIALAKPTDELSQLMEVVTVKLDNINDELADSWRVFDLEHRGDIEFEGETKALYTQCRHYFDLNGFNAAFVSFLDELWMAMRKSVMAIAHWVERSLGTPHVSQEAPTGLSSEPLEDRKMASAITTLESAIALLEDTKDHLSPVQLHSLNTIAGDFGIQLGHRQAGLTLEAWGGDRARQMRALTLDAFKETLSNLTSKPA